MGHCGRAPPPVTGQQPRLEQAAEMTGDKHRHDALATPRRPARMKRVLKWIGWVAALVVALALFAVGAAYVAFRNTVPSATGALAVAGLSSPVEIVRDKEGVPHIFAPTTDDLFMALGF